MVIKHQNYKFTFYILIYFNKNLDLQYNYIWWGTLGKEETWKS
jgi:hypothetical protein